MKFDYDIAIIGAGAAGITAAKTAVGFGKKVALIENNKIGGECTWTGCVPSKALIKSAEIAHHIADAQKWGITTDATFNTENVMNYVHSRIQKIYEHTTPETFEALGIKMFMKPCQFVDKHTLKFDDQMITATYSIICTGSSPFVPNIEGLQDVAYKTNETFFNQKRLPKSLLILGGGPIGAEMASACNRLGVDVTIIEMQDRILSHEDGQLVEILSKYMQDEGVHIKTGYKAIYVVQDGDEIVLTCIDAQEKKHTLKAEQLLVAVGRKPNIEHLDLHNANVEVTKKGIKTDTYMRTTAANIYACGDVVGPYLFSHMAWQQAVTAVRNICIPIFKKSIDYRNVIWATFTAPELASAGLTEKQAIDKFGQKNVILYKQPYKTLDRAITDNAQTGMVKVVCDKKGNILGIHILGAHASDIIHEAQCAKWYNLRLQDLQPIIHAYPTYSELIWQTGKQAYVDNLMRNPLVKIAKWFSRT
jgi:pyruvate/2-oxoglutarate dehydrogenase complex dihydrolipoamide dehydrogenase (E3) component